MTRLREIVTHLDALLKPATVADWPNALNGLQFENDGTVRKIAAAVDACEFTMRAAAESGADFLLVHHGLFWPGAQPVTGATYRKWKLAIENNLAIYSAHLPLDLHPTLGNNALLCRALGFRKLSPFFMEKGRAIGWKSTSRIPLKVLVARLERAVGGPVHVCSGGPAVGRRIGVVTGGAGDEVARAAAEGVDTFITGEGPHHSFTLAEELGVNLLLAGHYATETFGVKAVAARLSTRFRLPWEFIDHPTGL
jgi:dinuclear metal center YbgI/SA1388 family protein